MSVIYAIILNEYKLNYQTVFSANFDKQDQDHQVLDEIELFFHLINNPILAETAVDNIDKKTSSRTSISKTRDERTRLEFRYEYFIDNISFTKLMKRMVHLLKKFRKEVQPY